MKEWRLTLSVPFFFTNFSFKGFVSTSTVNDRSCGIADIKRLAQIQLQCMRTE